FPTRRSSDLDTCGQIQYPDPDLLDGAFTDHHGHGAEHAEQTQQECGQGKQREERRLCCQTDDVVAVERTDRTRHEQYEAVQERMPTLPSLQNEPQSFPKPNHGRNISPPCPRGPWSDRLELLHRVGGVSTPNHTVMRLTT